MCSCVSSEIAGEVESDEGNVQSCSTDFSFNLVGGSCTAISVTAPDQAARGIFAGDGMTPSLVACGLKGVEHWK